MGAIPDLSTGVELPKGATFSTLAISGPLSLNSVECISPPCEITDIQMELHKANV